MSLFLFNMEEITTYVRSEGGTKIIVMKGDRRSFRCRQRNKINGERVKPLKFVSFKEMQKEIKKGNYGRVGETRYFNTLGKL